MSKHLTANVAPVDVLIQNKKFQIIPKIEQVRIPSYIGPAKHLKKECTYTRQFPKSGIEEMLKEVLKKKSMHLKKICHAAIKRRTQMRLVMKAVKEGHAVKKTAALKTTQFAVSSANVSQCRFELRQPFRCSKTLRQFFELFDSEARQIGIKEFVWRENSNPSMKCLDCRDGKNYYRVFCTRRLDCEPIEPSLYADDGTRCDLL